jgi:histidyl-tRNA synthetase
MGKSTYETPKGTRDFLPSEMRTRSHVLDRVRAHFQRFGFEELDTPAFEYLEVLTLKAGAQAEHEIYSFEDKGGRKLGLRFDLTSSTGRMAASHPELPRPIYRYQIGKVWRYDRPQAGRYREFYQADADILGSYSSDCEVELLLMATEVLRDFGLDEYQLVINNRKILDAQVRASGIPKEKKPDALRALDKLLKVGKDGMRSEFVKYGLTEQQFEDFFATIVVDDLQAAAERVGGDETGRQGVDELREIFAKAERLGFYRHLKFDWTLVRGLDYYTGPIFEAQAKTESGFGSFGGGGRYDDLVELYGGQPEGAVGLSFGVERLIGLLEERGLIAGAAEPPVLVAPLDPVAAVTARELGGLLRAAGLSARVLPVAKSRGQLFKYSTATGLNALVLVDEDAVQRGEYEVRVATEKGRHEARAPRERLAAQVMELLMMTKGP